jgi:hypothetical protein
MRIQLDPDPNTDLHRQYATVQPHRFYSFPNLFFNPPPPRVSLSGFYSAVPCGKVSRLHIRQALKTRGWCEGGIIGLEPFREYFRAHT